MGRACSTGAPINHHVTASEFVPTSHRLFDSVLCLPCKAHHAPPANACWRVPSADTPDDPRAVRGRRIRARIGKG